MTFDMIVLGIRANGLNSYVVTLSERRGKKTGEVEIPARYIHAYAVGRRVRVTLEPRDPDISYVS